MLRSGHARTLTALMIPVLLAVTPRALAWGVLGHRYINRLAIACLPAHLRPLYIANQNWIVQHSVDPDDWREQHREEGPQHFIDLDTWGEDAAAHFPQAYQAACAQYGKAAVDKNGVVPWRIGQYYNKLIQAFKAHDARAIVETSAWLGHYAADIHVPFHAVSNYDGQLTGQKGVHARFESLLVERQVKFENLVAVPASPISDPVAAAFSWARASLKFSHDVLRADKEAAGTDPAYGDAYYAAFGAQARPIAIQRLREGGHDLASLWLSAWIAAGRPALPGAIDIHMGEPIDRPTHDPDLPAPIGAAR